MKRNAFLLLTIAVPLSACALLTNLDGLAGRGEGGLPAGDGSVDTGAIDDEDASDVSDPGDGSDAASREDAFVDASCPIQTFGQYPNNISVGVSGTGVNWSTPDKARVQDAVSTVADVGGTKTPARQLIATNYRFAIPSTAVIRGITVKIRRRGEGQVYDSDLRLLVNGAVVGINHATTNFWFSSLSTISYGGPSDLWGVTLTPDLVNSDSFGAVVSVVNPSGSSVGQGQVDAVSIDVAFTDCR